MGVGTAQFPINPYMAGRVNVCLYEYQWWVVGAADYRLLSLVYVIVGGQTAYLGVGGGGGVQVTTSCFQFTVVTAD